MAEVQKKLQDIVARLGAEKKFALILQKGALIWSDPAQSVDMTDSVLEILNKELPKIAVKIPSEKELMAALSKASVPAQ
jgi:hypothetical protein